MAPDGDGGGDGDQGTRPRSGRVLGVALDDVSWLVPTRARIPPGASAPGRNKVVVPQGTVNRLLVERIVRVVADLPRGSSPRVVWDQPPHELLVHTDATAATLTSGLVRVRVGVECDQTGRVDVEVPIAVGTTRKPAGLMMATTAELAGPAAVVGPWSDAITAFAWESLVELCRQLAAAVGRDERGRALIPGRVAATGNHRLVVEPMARHDRSLRIVS